MFVLHSPAFADAGRLPEKFAEGGAVSPPLRWEGRPTGTKSYALTMTDPDVPDEFRFPRIVFHWIVYDIPTTVDSLDAGLSPGGLLPSGAKELPNDFAAFGMPALSRGYGPPWPPDAPHRYVFTLYALKVAALRISADADPEAFCRALLPQTILTATLVGLYGPALTSLSPGAA